MFDIATTILIVVFIQVVTLNLPFAVQGASRAFEAVVEQQVNNPLRAIVAAVVVVILERGVPREPQIAPPLLPSAGHSKDGDSS